MHSDLCFGCKKFLEIDYIQPDTERPFCAPCSLLQPLTSDEVAFILLVAPDSPFGPLFVPGDEVEVCGEDESVKGTGKVIEISMNPNLGNGSPIYPTYQVAIDESSDQDWFAESALKKLEKTR